VALNAIACGSPLAVFAGTVVSLYLCVPSGCYKRCVAFSAESVGLLQAAMLQHSLGIRLLGSLHFTKLGVVCCVPCFLFGGYFF